MRTKMGLGLLVGLAFLLPTAARAEETIDTSHIHVKKKIADRMTAQELQAYKERMARNLAARRSEGTSPGPDTPADACTGATTTASALPFGPVSDTTTGNTDNYDLPADVTNPTCTASSNCTGTGPAGSLPRGAIYTGTGVGPDRAYKIRTNANCDLTIAMTPPDDDLALIAYQSACSNNLSDCVCVSDTGFAGDTETVVLSAVAGTDYFVVIDGYSTGGTPPGPDGPFSLTISGSGCSLVAAPLNYHTLTPCRLIDTRNPNGPLGGPALVAGADRTFQATGNCGVPAGASAVFLNITVVSPTVAGNLRIFPTGAALPTVSAINYSGAQTRGNNGAYALDGSGRFDIRCAQASGTAHVIVDVAGYFFE